MVSDTSPVVKSILIYRQLSIPSTSSSDASPSMISSPPIDLGDVSSTEEDKTLVNGEAGTSPANFKSVNSITHASPVKEKLKASDTVAERTDELCGLFVGFAFALQSVLRDYDSHVAHSVIDITFTELDHCRIPLFATSSHQHISCRLSVRKRAFVLLIASRDPLVLPPPTFLRKR